MLRQVFFVVISLSVVGCSRQGQGPKEGDKIEGVVLAPPVAQPGPQDNGKVIAMFDPLPGFLSPGEPANEKYDAALTQALTLLAEQDLAKALDAFEAARAEKDTEFVRGEIDKLKLRLNAEQASKKTLAEIQSVLDNGDPKDAAKLVDQALQTFGGGASAGKLVQLQAQADALFAAQTNEDPKVRFQRLRDQAQVALQDDQLRAASSSLQQAVQLFDDLGAREQLRDIQVRLDKYDGLRRRAAELRRDPNDVDDALELYRQAAQTWNTPEVRQDVDDCVFALQRRRETISVADFETLGDVGAPAAGHVLADELLPTFKARFDLVDRDQVVKALRDLNLADNFQNHPAQQREVGQAARVRFLVLGSVRRNGAVTAQARIVDTQSGLIVQTAKVSAPTFEELLTRLPELTKQLLMSDAEKLAYDQEQLRVAQRIEPVAANAPLPPAPVIGAPANGPWFDAAPPPAFGQLQINQFQALPQPLAQPQVVIVEPPPPLFRSRLVQTVVLQGDGLFARGHYREAFRQYEFALSLAPNDFDIRARLEATRPMLPPVAIAPIALRPRIAILNFLVVGNPQIVPPGLSIGVPDLLAPYFRVNYDIVDTGEIYWMMGRLGMSQADLMNDPNARRWLGRALHAQFFLMGTVQQTASFDVNTYLLNAEQGWVQGAGRMHVRNPYELRIRAGELAQITQLPPGQRAQFLAAEPQVNLFLSKGQDSLRLGNFQVAVTFFTQALALRPNNVQANLYLNQANQSHRAWELEQLRRKDLARQQALAAETQRRQVELARAAEAARIRAAKESKARAEAERFALAQQRRNAYGDMIAKGRSAAQGKNYSLAVNLFQGALDLMPPGTAQPMPLPVPHDALLNELAQARAEIARANAQKIQAEKIAGQESALRQKRDRELAVARQKIDDDRKKSEIEAAAQQQLIDAKYQAAFNQGQLLLSQNKFEAAIVALQGARQLKKTDTVDAMLNTAVSRQAEATAQAKGEGERKLLEEKFAAERKRRKLADEEMKRNHDAYEQAIKSGQAALAEKNPEVAAGHFEAAGKLFKTEAVDAGLKQVRAARFADMAARQAEKDKAATSERVTKLLGAGVAALDAGQVADSVQKLELARKLDPANVDVLAALSRAEQARNRMLIEQQQKALADAKQNSAKTAQDDEQKKLLAGKQQRAEAVKQALGRGQAALAANDFAGAIKAFQQTLALEPGQPQALQGLQQAQSAQAAAEASLNQAAKDKAAQLDELKKATALKQQRALALGQALERGQKAFAAKNFVEAIKDYQEALALQPGQPQALQGLQQAQSAQAEAAANIQAAKDKAAKGVQEEELKKAAALKQQRAAAFGQALERGQKSFAAKNFAEAIKAYQEALVLEPGQPLAAQGLQQSQAALQANQTAQANAKRYQQLLAEGQGLLGQRKFAEAIGPLQEALKIQPGDPAAGLLRQAQSALAETQAQQLAEQKRKTSFAEAIQGGVRLANQKKFPEALQTLQAAKALYPNDPQVNQLLAQTAQAWDAAKKADVPPPPKQEPPKQAPPKQIEPKKAPGEDPAKKKAADDRVQYQAHIARGQQLLTQRQFPQAAQQFEAALRLIPGDPAATAFLQQARTAKK